MGGYDFGRAVSMVISEGHPDCLSAASRTLTARTSGHILFLSMLLRSLFFF